MRFRRIAVNRLVIVPCCVAVLCSAARADPVLYVDDDAPPGGDGSSWSTAYRFLQDAIAHAGTQGADEIRVAQGLYRPDRDQWSPHGSHEEWRFFRVPNGVAIRGGYAGPGAPDPDERDIGLYQTVLSGELIDISDPSACCLPHGDPGCSDAVCEAAVCDLAPTCCDDAWIAGCVALAEIVCASLDCPPPDHSITVVKSFSAGQTTILEGFVISGAEGDEGGGMRNEDSSLIVADCTFSSNTADRGAGMYNEGGQVTLLHCMFISNSATMSGGGIRNDQCDAVLTNCTFAQNDAGSIGGGMYINQCDPTVSGCTFDDNYAGDWGGAIYSFAGSPDITDCEFLRNSAFFGSGGRRTGAPPLPDPDRPAPMGGAIFFQAGDATVTNCTFTWNEAAYGGALYTTIGSTTVQDCTFSENSVRSASGGAVFNGAGTASYTNCSFLDNVASDGRGGGMYSHTTGPIVNCVFIGNSAEYGGGGLYNYDSTTRISNCVFEANSAYGEFGTQGLGGGMHNEYGSPTIDGCTFTGNSAIRGGAMYSRQGSSAVTRCVFNGNTASGRGGGLYHIDDTSTINACVFDANTAGGGGGGGMYNWTASPLVINCTFNGNSTSATGGGVYSFSDSFPTFSNCVLWDNDPDQFVDVDGSATTVRYSDIEGGWSGAGSGNMDADPLFVAPSGGDYHLQPGSPCIDAGFNNAVPTDAADLDGDGDFAEFTPFDLDGNPRFVDAPAAADTGCGLPVIVDIGAYEHQEGVATQPVRGDLDGNLVVNATDFLILLAAWGPCDGCCLGDLDNDGVADVADFLILLANWSSSAPR